MSAIRLRLLSLCALAMLALPPAAAAGSPVDQAARALIVRATPVTWVGDERTGSAWKNPADQSWLTGRGNGAAGIGMAFLAAYDAVGRAAYLKEAGAAGDFLLAAQVPAGSGRWPTAYGPSGPAFTVSTSFEQGVPGIADFLWQLYERDGNARYAQAALAGMDWEASQFLSLDEHDNGLSHGLAGIAWTFNAFAERRAGVDSLRSVRYSALAQIAAANLQSQMVRTKLPRGGTIARIPEREGGHVFAPGFDEGAAGDAFLFYQLYRTTGRPQYRRDGDLLLAGLRADAATDGSCAGVTWAVDSGANRNIRESGVERGTAGIGWVALHAYRLLIAREPALAIKDLELARAAGDWLLSPCAKVERGGKSAGVASFLNELYRATGSPSYAEGAAKVRKSLASTPANVRGADIFDVAARMEGWPLGTPVPDLGRPQ